MRLPVERIDYLIEKMDFYHDQNETLRKHVENDKFLNENALVYTAMWRDLSIALQQLKVLQGKQ